MASTTCLVKRVKKTSIDGIAIANPASQLASNVPKAIVSWISCQNTPALLAQRFLFTIALAAKLSHIAADPVSSASTESVAIAFASPVAIAQIITPVAIYITRASRAKARPNPFRVRSIFNRGIASSLNGVFTRHLRYAKIDLVAPRAFISRPTNSLV